MKGKIDVLAENLNMRADLGWGLKKDLCGVTYKLKPEFILGKNQSRQREIHVQRSKEGEGGMLRENSIETCILSRVKQITSPGWMHETSARAWCTGKTQRDRVKREERGGIGMGNTCKPMADSCQCMTKTTTVL